MSKIYEIYDDDIFNLDRIVRALESITKIADEYENLLDVNIFQVLNHTMDIIITNMNPRNKDNLIFFKHDFIKNYLPYLESIKKLVSNLQKDKELSEVNDFLEHLNNIVNELFVLINTFELYRKYEKYLK